MTCINKIYDAQQKVKTDALKAAYDQNMADYDAQAAKIPQTYNEARRQVSTQADISRANLNEQMAGSGINTGAGSQLALSQQNSRNAAMGKVSSAEADALSALEAQRAKVKTAYQNAVAQAISENDAARAKALYTEAQRVDNSIVNTAVKQLSVDTTLAENDRSRLEQQAATLAKYGDFSGYAALGYSQDQIDAMQKVWGAQNPKLYYERTGTYPASYTASNSRKGGDGGDGGDDDDTIPPKKRHLIHNDVNYHNDIDFTDPNAVADAATVYERVKQMISQGTPVSEVDQYIQSASDNGLIGDDSRIRMKSMNHSRK